MTDRYAFTAELYPDEGVSSRKRVWLRISTLDPGLRWEAWSAGTWKGLLRLYDVVQS